RSGVVALVFGVLRGGRVGVSAPALAGVGLERWRLLGGALSRDQGGDLLGLRLELLRVRLGQEIVIVRRDLMLGDDDASFGVALRCLELRLERGDRLGQVLALGLLTEAERLGESLSLRLLRGAQLVELLFEGLSRVAFLRQVGEDSLLGLLGFE